MSMRTVWDAPDGKKRVVAPVSLVATAFGRVSDARRALTPELRRDRGPTRLVLVDLGSGQNRLGASALAQVHGALGETPPDLDDPALLRGLFHAVRELERGSKLLAYHDRSDGGLFVTLCEMAFAGATGVEITLDGLGEDPLAALFSEELGVVLQVLEADVEHVLRTFERHGLRRGRGAQCHVIGGLREDRGVVISSGDRQLFAAPFPELKRVWSEASSRIQALRDNSECAAEELELVCDGADPGLQPALTFDPEEAVEADLTVRVSLVAERPRVAILREQGVNGQVEMAAAFTRVGFVAVDVHMSDLLEGRLTLEGFKGLAACGGFSYGDVLGAGQGWAKSILWSARARESFERFFARVDTFALGVCNGCQMFAALKGLIPGAGAWPRFERNQSEQFEARLSLVEVRPSRSLFFAGMEGSRLPVAVAHGEGRAQFASAIDESTVHTQGLVALRFVDHHGRPTTHYPENPNGSPGGVTGLTTPNGRVLALMPHPERVFRSVQLSWAPEAWPERSPWLRLFANARTWVG